jgi:hypothetical protein
MRISSYSVLSYTGCLGLCIRRIWFSPAIRGASRRAGMRPVDLSDHRAQRVSAFTMMSSCTLNVSLFKGYIRGVFPSTLSSIPQHPHTVQSFLHKFPRTPYSKHTRTRSRWFPFATLASRPPPSSVLPLPLPLRSLEDRLSLLAL